MKIAEKKMLNVMKLQYQTTNCIKNYKPLFQFCPHGRDFVKIVFPSGIFEQKI